MSRRTWHCRNSACPIRGGAILGKVTRDGGLVLDPAVQAFRCFLDTGRSVVVCPACGQEREFRGGAVIGDRESGARQEPLHRMP